MLFRIFLAQILWTYSSANEKFVVKTSVGEIQGVAKKGYSVFYGIPYAEPPVNELRWKKPVPKSNFTSPFDASKSSNRYCCIQDSKTETNEDCLNLSIFTPSTEQDYPLATMIWIHGGAYESGCGDQNGAQLGGRTLVELPRNLGFLVGF